MPKQQLSSSPIYPDQVDGVSTPGFASPSASGRFSRFAGFGGFAVWGGALALVGWLSVGAVTPAVATTVTLRNGLQLEGRVAEVASVKFTGLEASPTQIKGIYVVDDGLRRVFFSVQQVQNSVPKDDLLETIQLEFNRPPPAGNGRMVASVGSIINIGPFDEYGRRVFSIAGPQGKLDIVQGITEVNSRYVKVEGLFTQTPYTWDMRVATSSIPRNVLSDAIMRQIDPTDPDQRLKLFRLYTEAELYRDAKAELEKMKADFPDMKRLDVQLQLLNQLRANRLVRELERLRDSGQHGYVYYLLKNFRTDGVAAETLLKVRDMVGHYERENQQRLRTLTLLEQHFGALKPEVKPDIEQVLAEIKNELNVHTLARMGPYLRLADDASLGVSQKMSLALSGWLMGSDQAKENLAETQGLCNAVPLIREYLQSPHPHVRNEARLKLSTLEGVTPQTLADMLKIMKPPKSLADAKELGPGFYEVTATGPHGEDLAYLVQLPPEYTPHRKYPCIVTLHGGSTPEMQIDFWAGGFSAGRDRRHGQATRHGYIVIAPRWAKPGQRKYEYSFQEHAATLGSLRDAMQRLSLDTDRVFLTGHSMGGDAAWDIGLAHPDLWAGVMPFSAGAGKYVAHYWKNAKRLPLYFVTGDMDAGRPDDNAREWDRYLKKPGFNCIVSEYQGRAHESFPDELQHIFRWMGLQQRDFAPEEFEVVTMREWDNFFWFLEVDGMPAASMVAPVAYPKPKVRELSFKGKALDNKTHHLISLQQCAANQITVYFSADYFDFKKPCRATMVSWRDFKVTGPDVGVMLEDVRTRGDRLHPFWAKAVK